MGRLSEYSKADTRLAFSIKRDIVSRDYIVQKGVPELDKERSRYKIIKTR